MAGRLSSNNSPKKTGEIVLSAVKKLMKNTGWTSRTIIKFIRMEYGITDSSIGGKVSRALKRGVRLGLLQLERGRYRLNDMSKLARPVTARDIRKQQPKTRRHEMPLRVHSPANSAERKRRH